MRVSVASYSVNAFSRVLKYIIFLLYSCNWQTKQINFCMLNLPYDILWNVWKEPHLLH